MLFPDPVRFIISGCSGRVGTEMLISMLNQHPEVTCFSEILNLGEPSLINNEQFPIYQSYKYWRTKIATMSGVVGFKVFAFQLGEIVEQQDRRDIVSCCRVVYLDRKNPFDAMLSRVLASRERLFIATRYSNEPVFLDPAKVKEHLDWQHLDNESFSKKLRETALGFFPLFYEDIQSRFADVLRFLCVAPLPTPVPLTIKQRAGTKRDYIGNYDELKTYFADTAYAPFLDET